MANYTASCRTNTFSVKDDDAFIQAMSIFPAITVLKRDRGFTLINDDPNNQGWPTHLNAGNNDDCEEFDFPAFIANHLADGEVAIFMEIGSEKMNYLVGVAMAINNKHESRQISLDAIYNLAKELGEKDSIITEACY